MIEKLLGALIRLLH